MVSPNEKERFIEELKELPIVSVICKRLGIARATYYRWMQEDSDFNDKVSIALKTGRENITDIAEGQLVASIRKAERWALTYWLEANSDRYYKPRKTHDTMKPEYRGVTEFVIVRDCNNPEHDKGNRKTDIRIERREIEAPIAQDIKTPEQPNPNNPIPQSEAGLPLPHKPMPPQ